MVYVKYKERNIMYKIENVKPQPIMMHTLSKSTRGNMRNKLTVLDVSGMTWLEKKKLVEKEIMIAYGDIPEHVLFLRRQTVKNKTNPDGLRLFIFCPWLKRNRFDDYGGVIKLGQIFKAFNKQIEGKTNPDLLVEEQCIV